VAAEQLGALAHPRQPVAAARVPRAGADGDGRARPVVADDQARAVGLVAQEDLHAVGRAVAADVRERLLRGAVDRQAGLRPQLARLAADRHAAVGLRVLAERRGQRLEPLGARQRVAAQGGDGAAGLVEPAGGEVVGALHRRHHLGGRGAVPREQPRRLELQGEGREGVGEHVVHVARHPGALAECGRLRVRLARLPQLLHELLQAQPGHALLADEADDEEPRDDREGEREDRADGPRVGERERDELAAERQDAHGHGLHPREAQRGDDGHEVDARDRRAVGLQGGQRDARRADQAEGEQAPPRGQRPAPEGPGQPGEEGEDRERDPAAVSVQARHGVRGGGHEDHERGRGEAERAHRPDRGWWRPLVVATEVRQLLAHRAANSRGRPPGDHRRPGGAARTGPPPAGGGADPTRAAMTERSRSARLPAMITSSLEVTMAAGASPPAAPAVSVRGLRKAYGGRPALDGVDLEIRAGEVLALLGPNGAGKTTLVEILEGHRAADGGEVRVLGFAPSRRERAFRERIGIVLQEEGLDPAITVGEAIALYGAAYPRPRPVGEVAALVGLEDRLDARAQTLSGGQKRRLDLALGIAGDPDLVFLDEPTTGFDPAARRQSWELIEGLRALGKTILLTTHYMDEAQHLADRVVVLARGRVIAEGTPGMLGSERRTEAVVAFRLPDGVSALDVPLPAAARLDGRHVRFASTAPTRDLAPLVDWATRRSLELDGLTVTRPTLEDVYLELTQETPA
jgi:ABC-2 type transport system ATP-binding protein